MLLLKVLVLLTVTASAAWASNPLSSTGAGFSVTGVPGPTLHAIYKSDSEPGDQGQGGSSGMMTRPMVMAVTVGTTAMRAMKAIARRNALPLCVAAAEGCVRWRSNRKT